MHFHKFPPRTRSGQSCDFVRRQDADARRPDKIAPSEPIRQSIGAVVVSEDRLDVCPRADRSASMNLKGSNAFGVVLLGASIAILLVGLFHPETSGETLDDVARSLAEH